jgi:hypothetical protein
MIRMVNKIKKTFINAWMYSERTQTAERNKEDRVGYERWTNKDVGILKKKSKSWKWKA